MSHSPASPFFLIFYSRYHTTSIALFQGNRLLGIQETENQRASATLPLLVTTLLTQHTLTFAQLTFVGVYQGPAPFTSLRVVLAFTHGLLFATKIPLIGINGFDAFAYETDLNPSEQLLILLDAFCNEVYYALFDHTKTALLTGYGPCEKLIPLLSNLTTGTIIVKGNARNSLQNFTHTILNQITLQIAPLSEPADMPSVESVGAQALARYRTNSTGDGFLLPLYLKRPAVNRCAESPSPR